MPSEISRTIPKSRREGGWMPNAKEVSKTATGEAALIIWMNCQPSLSGRAIRGRPKRLTSRGSMVMMMREKSKKYEKQMGSPQISLIISFGTLHSHKNLVPKGFFFHFFWGRVPTFAREMYTLIKEKWEGVCVCEGGGTQQDSCYFLL